MRPVSAQRGCRVVAPGAQQTSPAMPSRGLLLLLAVCCAAADPDKTKRQIFREYVNPHSGGKIPEGAFRADRLALNKLNKDGISIPDGVLLETRPHDKHPHAERNHDLRKAVIKVVLTPEGRYVPPEGRYHHASPPTVDSTYVIRPPIGAYKHELRRPHRPLPANLELPTRMEPPQPINNELGFLLGLGSGHLLLPHSAHTFFSDHLYPYYSPQPLSELDALLRRLQEQGRARAAPRSSAAALRLPGVEGLDHAALAGPPSSFSCRGRGRAPGMFADRETRCQVFHSCQSDGRHDSFICPKGTAFSEALNNCDWWYNVQCG
ncbi:uncharacterized protein LOC134533365 [Bacillus rossius redtenbacheri]|uniref:uncharacterized protein LOC134533365 n=1 Tax=Bacillus rossius redtenbacheri TaxID=93214 RepID=UPI002FDDB3ED